MSNPTRILAEHLAALSCLRAAGDIRTYLDGVHIEAKAGEGYIAVATNGAVIGVIKHDDPGIDASFKVLVPPPVLEQLGKAKDVDIELVDADKMRWVMRRPDGLAFEWTDNRGVFPDWRRVMPKPTAAVRPAHLNPAYADLFHKAAAKLGVKPLKKGVPALYVTTYGPEECALVRIRGVDSFAGGWMPLRPNAVDLEDRTVPAWLATA